jgi:hypothetical protein
MARWSPGVPEKMDGGVTPSGGQKRTWPRLVRSTDQPCRLAALSRSRRSTLALSVDADNNNTDPTLSTISQNSPLLTSAGRLAGCGRSSPHTFRSPRSADQPHRVHPALTSQGWLDQAGRRRDRPTAGPASQPSLAACRGTCRGIGSARVELLTSAGTWIRDLACGAAARPLRGPARWRDPLRLQKRAGPGEMLMAMQLGKVEARQENA